MIRLDESKLKILELLVKPMTVTEIARKMKLSKATVSHHLKLLEKSNLVKVVETRIERNFIKKYYVSTLHTPDLILPQEKVILDKFELSREEFLRTVLRLLNAMNLENALFLKKVGFDVGYFSLADKVDGKIDEALADTWEKLKLGKVVESSSKLFIVEECYNCAGLPAVGKPYCKIDEGIIEGILQKKTGKRFKVDETKCWGTGYEVCEFRIRELK